MTNEDSGSGNGKPFSNPLRWERIPEEDTGLGFETYRALVDGRGWVVVMIPLETQPGEHRCMSSVWVPDEGEMWGKQMLCRSCEHRQYVEAKETGLAFERCQVFERPLREFGQVTKCSNYEARDLPYLFTREAWTVQKGEDGEIEIVSPEEQQKRAMGIGQVRS